MTDQSDIRQLLHAVQTLRRDFSAALDGIEARLAAMAGPESSFQVPDDWSVYLERGTCRTSSKGGSDIR